MTTATGDIIHYNYDGLKRLESTAIKNSSGTTLFRTGYGYKAGAATNQTTTRIGVYTTWNPDYTSIYSYRYEYDAVGNITQVKDAKNSNRVIAAYTYDVQNQLIEEIIYSYTGTSTTPSNTTSYEYTYDTAGNILTEIKNCVVTKTYTYNDNNGNWNDLLTSVNGYSITYDAIGNPEVYRNGEMTSYNTPVTYYMEWEQGRQLTYLEVASDDQLRVSYDYDLDGIRTSKLVESIKHEYVTQNGKVVGETIGTGSTAKVLDFIYDASGRPFALKYKNGTAATETYYYVLNLQGDVVALMTASREIKAEYTYNAWGEILTATGEMASVNPLRYRGYYYDAETGFYYLQSRYYDPTMHRFINADSYQSTGQGFVGTNMFAYCRNCPVLRADAEGNYDRDAAVDYAKEWYDDANTDEYEYFGNRGGDCANFVSQCLSAGKIKENKGWFCKRSIGWSWALILYNLLTTGTIYQWRYSDSWLFADDQFRYFSNAKNGYINGVPIHITNKDDLSHVIESYNIQKGDLLYFCNSSGVYHATIISSVDDNMIYYSAHTKGRFDEPLPSSGLDVVVIRINDDA